MAGAADTYHVQRDQDQLKAMIEEAKRKESIGCSHNFYRDPDLSFDLDRDPNPTLCLDGGQNLALNPDRDLYQAFDLDRDPNPALIT